jgi:hypothetical protein
MIIGMRARPDRQLAYSLAFSIAASYGVSVGSLFSEQHMPREASARRALMLSLYGSGLTLSAIARTMGCHHTSVRSAVRRELGLQKGERTP